jgi:hypothetical protein
VRLRCLGGWLVGVEGEQDGRGEGIQQNLSWLDNSLFFKLYPGQWSCSGGHCAIGWTGMSWQIVETLCRRLGPNCEPWQLAKIKMRHACLERGGTVAVTAISMSRLPAPPTSRFTLIEPRRCFLEGVRLRCGHHALICYLRLTNPPEKYLILHDL